MMRKSRLLLLSFLMLSGLALGATAVRQADLGALVDEAELIFVGTVIGIESVPTQDQRYAFTYVTFDVEQTLKGTQRSGKIITLRFAGGQVGDTMFEVTGAPRFAAGGRHLLFVEGNDRLGVPLVGWVQGKLDVGAAPVSGPP